MRKRLTDAQWRTMLAAKEEKVFRREPFRMTCPMRIFGGNKGVVKRLIKLGFLKETRRDDSWQNGIFPIVLTSNGEQVLKDDGYYDA